MEELKNTGNEEYNGGHVLEAISFYSKAIALYPQNSPYHKNKAAALACLGRYAEAVEECFKTFNCDPLYSYAHHRLGSLHLRFGQVEDTKQHLKLSGQEIDSEILQNLQRIETHLTNIRSAQKVEDWRRILTESNLTIEAGADASYKVHADIAKALLKLNKPKKSLEVLTTAKKSSGNKSRKVHNRDWDFLIIEAQRGLFSDARGVGNEYFKAETFLEACMAYSRGLEYFPTNSVLLSNRVACRIKPGKWEMAAGDCNVALRSQFNNTKALLHRTQSNTRLESWEESLRNYTVLNKERPEDIPLQFPYSTTSDVQKLLSCKELIAPRT
ncbi:hypothetical protein GIB67_042587 [Kingdonia uniflora]|uniref:Tetratricopeptide repeat protein n=1 Tax=Kingdonia uniflora TaxID=39325 RepID=A0A7J7M1H7_9MAGN|nr:hypothetical protein GIB67_042587 [Kingdonia uniflora]